MKYVEEQLEFYPHQISPAISSIHTFVVMEPQAPMYEWRATEINSKMELLLP